MSVPKRFRASAPRTSIGKVAAGRDSTIYINNSTTTITHIGAGGMPAVETGSGLMVVGRIPRRASHFVDRAQVKELLATVARCAVAVVCGMPGAGKTQVAAAYAREIIEVGGPGLVAWVNAETPETLYSGLGEVAQRVGVANPDGDSAVSARRLRDHLSERQGPGLLVLDNATNPDLLDPLLPTGGVTRVVVTSTDRAFAQFGELVDAGAGFSRVESVRYLQEATGLEDPHGAEQVAADLGDLPLALSATAATISGRRLDYPLYRRLLAEHSLPVVLPRRRGSDHPLAVDQALLLAVHTIETASEETELGAVVRWVLGVMAMLAPDGVDRVMLPNRDARLDAALQRCVESSLVSWSVSGNVVVMHRLVARVLRERAHNLGELAADAAAVIEPLLFDGSEAFARREEGSRLVDHIEALWQAISNAVDLDPAVSARVLSFRSWATRQLIEAADTTRSLAQARNTLTDLEQVLGPDHPRTLASRNNLAYAYESAGLLDEAILLYEQNVTDCERSLGPDHPDTLNSRNNLASTYQSAGLLDKAIPLHEQNVTDRERSLGPDHPDTLNSRNNLAHTYQSAGLLDKAIPLHEQNVTDRERSLGPDHPDTLLSHVNLASAYESAGRLDEAIPLYERCLTDYEHVMGLGHPATLTWRKALASAYESARRLDEAIPLHKQNVTVCEQALGPDHPFTLALRDHLADAYETAERLDEAIPLYEQNVTDCKRILGADHPDTLTSRGHLASAYESAGRLDEAIPLYKQCLTDRERILGPHHSTLATRNSLAGAYESAGRLDEAIPLYEQNVTDCKRILGPDHPDTLTSRNNLGCAYWRRNNRPEPDV
ncbi:tetratricopeptide repeat protein [Nocardia sp. CS682]|uniref:tetratricopeptide repeat protein n=1 Tax=Nocardia sp. CS682 TaxID=1047172 RepID=UPI00107509A6|nr:tetratricopeptide repeat protein [Nocardia sp. CS682]QBS41316.1 tetratricopeptide repeat protein [Nocardia sp. CS682]